VRDWRRELWSAIRAFLQDLEGAAEHALNGTLDPHDIFGVPPSLEDCDRLLRKARQTLALPQ
jgi:hypothetical protein